MKTIHAIQIMEHNKEEILPEFSSEFPYIATRAELDKYIDPFTPWHWHKAVELFYIESGSLEYHTPHGKWFFPSGSGGMINSNVLHRSIFQKKKKKNIQFLHLFDPSFLSGEHGSRIERKYILPMTAASNIELIPFYPDNPTHLSILENIKNTFCFSENEWGYELKIREQLVHIWLKIFELEQSSIQKASIQKQGHSYSDEKLKTMLIYIHEHFQEDLSVEHLSQAVHLSKRSCFRLFQETLHMTPMEYLRDYRLQITCRMLTQSEQSITEIAYLCGFGSSSYFSKIFRTKFHCTPFEYRKQWHDCYKK